MAGQVATVETVTQIFINLTDVVATYHNTRPGLAPHLATGLFQAFALLSIPEMVAEKIASRRPLFNIEVAGGRITDTPFSWFFFCFAQRLHDSDKAMFERIVKELRNNPNMTLSLWEINHYFPKFFGDLVWQQMPEVDIFA